MKMKFHFLKKLSRGKILKEEISNDLKEFGVDTDEPDLFNS